MKIILKTMVTLFLAVVSLPETNAQSGMAFPCGWSPDSMTYYGKPLLYSLSYNPVTEFFTVSAVFDTTVAPTQASFMLNPGAQVTVVTSDGFGPTTGTTASSGGISTVVEEAYSSANQQTLDDNLFASVPAAGPYPAACAGNEYHTFGVSANFAPNGVVSGVPVSLFHFKGNSCAGTVALMDQYDQGASALYGAVGIGLRNSAQLVMEPSGTPLAVDRYCGNLQPSPGITRQIPDGVNENYTSTSGLATNGDVMVNEYAVSPAPPIYNIPRSMLTVTRIASSNTAYDPLLNLNADGTFTFNTPLSPSTGTYSFTYQYATTCNQTKTAQATISWGVPLPVTLVSFTAQKTGSTVLLKWETSPQSNSNRFDVEYSSNGNQWNVLGSVNAKENQNSYSLYDGTPSNKVNYYRLKLIDKDQKSAFSNTVVVDMSMSRPVQISPNPATDMLHVALNGNNVIYSEVYDMTGKLIKTIKSGSDYYQFSVADLSPGLYVMKLYYGDRSTQILKWSKG